MKALGALDNIRMDINTLTFSLLNTALSPLKDDIAGRGGHCWWKGTYIAFKKLYNKIKANFENRKNVIIHYTLTEYVVLYHSNKISFWSFLDFHSGIISFSNMIDHAVETYQIMAYRFA